MAGEAGCAAGRSQRVQPLFLALHRPVGNAAGDRQMSLTRATDRRKKMPYDIVQPLSIVGAVAWCSRHEEHRFQQIVRKP